MTLLINGVLFKNVKDFCYNGDELEIIFEDNHKCRNIYEIEDILKHIDDFMEVGNYHFNYNDGYGNESTHGTDILYVIPERLRDNISIAISTGTGI